MRISASAGFARGWNFQSPVSKITALGVAKAGAGVPACAINGVCTPIHTGGGGGGQLPQAVLDREVGYTPVCINAADCAALGWLSLPPAAKVWMFVPDGDEGTPPGVGQSTTPRNPAPRAPRCV